MKKEKLVLAHPITNELNDKPLSAASETTYGPDWVKIATYMECITAGDYNVATASVGDELEIEVVFPVCCEVGGVFSEAFEYREAYFGDKVLGYHKYNTIFEHPHMLPDGSLSPEIPNRFMKSFRRWVTEKGVLSFMQGVINENDGVDIYKSMAGEIKVYVYKNGLLFGVDVEGFLYATKTMIEETEEVMNTTEYNEARELYDQLVRKIKSL